MRLCRFNDNRLGLVRGDTVYDVSAVLADLPAAQYPYPKHDVLIERLPALRAEIEVLAMDGARHAVADVQLLSPVGNPGKIIAAPVNYTKHLEEVLAQKQLNHGKLIDEIHRAGLFLKATSAVIGAGSPVALIKTDRRNDHEIELAVVIGTAGRNIPRDKALAHVAGYCIGLDITIRGPEERSLRKSPDSYAVLGPWLVTPDELGDPGHLDFSLHVDGELRQQANTDDLILDVPALIEFASAFYTLHPGDVILTGTPQGVSPIVPGNTMSARMQGIGAMDVRVTAA